MLNLCIMIYILCHAHIRGVNYSTSHVINFQTTINWSLLVENPEVRLLTSKLSKIIKVFIADMLNSGEVV